MIYLRITEQVTAIQQFLVYYGTIVQNSFLKVRKPIFVHYYALQFFLNKFSNITKQIKAKYNPTFITYSKKGESITSRYATCDCWEANYPNFLNAQSTLYLTIYRLSYPLGFGNFHDVCVKL